jgi:hypothetical protein
MFYSFHRPVSYNIENTTFRKLDLFPSSGEGEDTCSSIDLGPSKGPNKVGVLHPHLRTETDPVSEISVF